MYLHNKQAPDSSGSGDNRKKENNLLKHYLKQKFLTLCQAWYMLEQLFSVKSSPQRCLVGGAAPRCPRWEWDIPLHTLAIIMISAVLCAHPEPSPAQHPPARQLLRSWMPQWHQQPKSAAAQLLNFPKSLSRFPREAGVCHQRLDTPAAPKSRMDFPCVRFLKSKTEFLSSYCAPWLLIPHLLKAMTM